MLQGHRITWETCPQAGLPSVPAMNIPFLHNAFTAETDNAGGAGGGGGVYKDRFRWLAVLYVPSSGVQGQGQGRHHLLGRFESEDEANAAYKWVSLTRHHNTKQHAITAHPNYSLTYFLTHSFCLCCCIGT